MVGQFTSPLWCQFVIPKFRILATSLLIAPGCCEDEFGWWKPLENHSVWYNQKKWSILRTFKRIINILLSSVQNWIEKSHLSWVTSVQFSRSVVSDSATPWIAAHQTSLSMTNSQSLLKLMPIESVIPSNHLILCRPLLLLPPIPPSIRVFSNESVLYIRWSEYCSFSFSVSPSNDYSGLISFRMDWLDLLAI